MSQIHLLREGMPFTFINFYLFRIAFLLSTENEGNLHFQCLSDMETRPKSKDSTSVQDFSKEDSCQVAIIERLTKNNGLETALECDSWLENMQGSQERHLGEMFTNMVHYLKKQIMNMMLMGRTTVRSLFLPLKTEFPKDPVPFIHLIKD